MAPISESKQKAVEALENRLMVGHAALLDVQKQVEDADYLIQRTISNLKNLFINSDGVRKQDQDGMYDLFSTESPVVKNFQQTLLSDLKNDVCIHGPWWKCIRSNNYFVIGAKITNLSESSLEGLNLLLHGNKVLGYRARVTDLGYDDTNKPVVKKKARANPGTKLGTCGGTLKAHHSAMVVAAVTVDSLQPDYRTTVTTSVMYRVEQLDGKYKDTCETLQEITVTSADILNSSNTLDISTLSTDYQRAREELVMLEASMLTTTVDFVSDHTSLLDVGTMLKESLHLQQHPLLGILYWTQPPCHLIEGSWIEVTNHPQVHEVQVTLHTRNEGNLLLLMNHLYNQLPEDVTILPASNDESVELLKQDVMDHMMRETTIALSFLDSIKSNEPKKSDQGNKILKIDSKKYNEFRKELASAETETDGIVVQLLN